MRTTRAQIEAQFALLKGAAQDHDIEGTLAWELNNAPIYGGYEITYPVGEHGGQDVLGGIGHRLPPSAFYAALRIAEAVLRYDANRVLED